MSTSPLRYLLPPLASVHSSSQPATVLGRHDKIFVYGKQSRISRALSGLSAFLEQKKGFVPPGMPPLSTPLAGSSPPAASVL
jgi:hypothetical protein